MNVNGRKNYTDKTEVKNSPFQKGVDNKFPSKNNIVGVKLGVKNLLMENKGKINVHQR